MFPDETRHRQERLNKEILLLASNMLDKEKEALGVISKLQLIYRDGFRHSYSDFFPIIDDIFREENNCNVEYLSNNLETIRNILEMDFSDGTKKYDDIYDQFTKLCDHLNLQISEMSVFQRNEHKINDAKIELESVQAELENARDELRSAQTELEKANKTAGSLQTELITVLSIFAAIVMTLSGGFSFLGSVMTSIASADYIEEVVLVAMICGMVIFNTIFLMMYLVGKLTEKNIYTKCLTKDCSCERDQKPVCSAFRRIQRRMPYIFYFNLFSVVGIVIDCIVWRLDFCGYL